MDELELSHINLPVKFFCPKIAFAKVGTQFANLEPVKSDFTKIPKSNYFWYHKSNDYINDSDNN